MPKFGWKAVFEDCVIRQYPMGSPETSFKTVREKGLPIKFFVGTKYGVNLSSGEFLIKGVWQLVGNLEAVQFVPKRLIYFRRNERQYDGVNPSKLVSVQHFVGYEFDSFREVSVDGRIGRIPVTGEVRLCIPDEGSQPTVCFGDVSNHV